MEKKYSDFKNAIKEFADKFRQIDEKTKIRIISHLDADGITASSILISALKRENRGYSISIVHQLTAMVLDELAKEDYEIFVFTDIGSGQIELIDKLIGKKQVFIMDHHELHDKNIPHINQINPHMFGIDGSNEVSGAGVVYLFAKALNPKNKELAHLAVIGAIGDIQEREGFMPLNREILDEAISQESIRIEKDLNLYGRNSRPLYKLLLYSSDMNIPGVTDNEKGVFSFLNQLGIEAKEGYKWRMLSDLSEDERKKLVAGIIIKRANEKKPEDIFAHQYTLVNEKEGSQFADAKEYSALLNACGRMNNPSLGIGSCLNDKKQKIMALQNYAQYKRAIVGSLNWFRANKANFVSGPGYAIINAENKVPFTIVGTMISIMSKQREFPPGTLLLSMARTDDGFTKASLRISDNINDVNLKEIMGNICSKISSQAGGHKNAAGAMIETEDEERFIAAAKEVFESLI